MVNEEYDQAVVKLLSREDGRAVQATDTLWLVIGRIGQEAGHMLLLEADLCLNPCHSYSLLLFSFLFAVPFFAP